MADRRPIGEDIDALIVRTREAHEVLKDLKAANKELRDTIKFAKEAEVSLLSACAVAIDEAIGVSIDEGLKNYSKSIEQAIETAQDAVYARFDIIAGILLGEQDEENDTVPMEDAARILRKSMKRDQSLTPMETYFMDQIQDTIRARLGDSYTERP